MGMTPKIYITYEMVFEEKPKKIAEYLQVLDRDWLIKFAIHLIQSGEKYELIKDYVSAFFCKDNISFVADVLSMLKKHTLPNPNDITNVIPRTYFIISEGTGLELLRQIFAIQTFVKNEPQIIQEQNLFKAILLINSHISEWNIPEEHNEDGSLTELFYAKAFMCSFLNNYERTYLMPEIIITFQFIKGYYFFKFCEQSKLREHLRLFLKRNGVAYWEQYLYNIIKLILYPLKYGKVFSIITLNDEGYGYTFLHSHSFPISKIIALDENVDYNYFKSHPLIEIDNKTFMPISAMLCINHLYKSIYFEFREINNLLKDTEHFLFDRGLWTTLTTEFSEQYLFDMIIRRVLSRKHGVKLSDRECKDIKKIGKEPDFYFRTGNNIFLFENKDVMINARTKSSGNYADIEEALKDKLITHSGIPQLITNIERISSDNFIWDKKIPNHPRVYPILVLDDSSICLPGLNYILNDEFQKQLKARNIKIKVHPLVVIELDTLIAFLTDFENGVIQLKDTIDGYYKYLKRCNSHVPPAEVLYEVFHMYNPFYTFISGEVLHRPFDDVLFGEICDEIKNVTDSVLKDMPK